MRHRVYGKKLGRNKNERTSLFRSLMQELFLRGTITTSETKAKAIKGLVDKVINLAKSKNTQRLLQTYFANKNLQDRLIKEIAPKLDSRVSGYTSLMKMGIQKGDKTTVVKMSLIGLEQLKPMEKGTGVRVQQPKASLAKGGGTVKKIEEKKQTKTVKSAPKTKPKTQRKTIKKTAGGKKS